jgi:hypothetical protein
MMWRVLKDKTIVDGLKVNDVEIVLRSVSRNIILTFNLGTACI